MSTLRWAGTKHPSSRTSWLPEPLMADMCQVSCTSTSAAGTRNSEGRSRPSMNALTWTQDECSTPEQ